MSAPKKDRGASALRSFVHGPHLPFHVSGLHHRHSSAASSSGSSESILSSNEDRASSVDFTALTPSVSYNDDERTLVGDTEPTITTGSSSPTLTKENGCVVSEALSAVDDVVEKYSKYRSSKKSNGVGVLQSEADDENDISGIIEQPVDTALNDAAIPQKIHRIFDHLPVFMKALEEVAKIHPFLQVVVLSFKAIYILETKRRNNEEKVVAIFAEMKDMLSMLIHLKTVKEGALDKDGAKIENRMRDLVETTAKDIVDCANVCDTYAKAKLIAKVLKGPMWEATFIQYVQLFASRRDQFKFVLSSYITLKVTEIDEKMDRLTEMTETIMRFVASYIPAEQKMLHEQVEKRGGPKAVLHDEVTLHELIASEERPHETRGRVRDDIDDVKKGLDDPAIVIQRNLQSFERKFAMQQRELLDDIDKLVRRESDRVIESVKSGPHNRILDKDLRNIWRDMGWRGNVKARHLVLAIRDYYHEKAEDRNHKGFQSEEVPSLHTEAWALPWISVKRLQTITEAFDDDASGYVTIGEVNNFMASKPDGWSLLHWLAYWAIGWQTSATIYRDKIQELFGKMFALRASIHNANRRLVDKYLDHIWQPITLLTSSLQSFVVSEKVQTRFQSYIDDEEHRVKRNLEATKYHIDDITTLSLITGPGRIDKHLFQLLYLFIKRDFEVIRLCRTRVIDQHELGDSIRSLWLVLAAVDDRHKELEEIFRHQNLDPSQQFKVTYCRLFDHYHDPSILFTRKKLRDSGFHQHHYDETEEAHDPDECAILNHPHEDAIEWQSDLDVGAYDTADSFGWREDHQCSKYLRAILGTWHGFLYTAESPTDPATPMFLIHIRPSTSKSEIFQASGEIPGSSMFSTFSLSGHWEITPQDVVTYSFVMECSAPFESKHFCGHLSETMVTLSGTWGAPGDVFGTFVFSRLQPEIFSCRPPPVEFYGDKTHTFWRFALSAIRSQVARQRYSWSFFSKRRDIRRRYVELLSRTRYGRPLDDDENQELKRYRRTLAPSDVRFYQSVCDIRLQTACHHGMTCDSCGGVINGGRIVCLDCDTHGKSFSTIDLCEDPRCVIAQIGLDRRTDLPAPHLPSHNIFKSRTTIHLRDFGKIELQALDALQRATAAFDDVDERSHEPVLQKPDGDRRSQPMLEGLSCILCSQSLSRPCWYCIECEGDVLICNNCDAKGGMSQGDHEASHALVRCPSRTIDKAALTLERRLDVWESRLSVMDNTFARLEGQMSEVDSRLHRVEAQLSRVDGGLAQVDQRLLRLEALLELISSKLT